MTFDSTTSMVNNIYIKKNEDMSIKDLLIYQNINIHVI